jgi:transposase
MRRQYDEEFKRQTARYILEEGKSVTQTARELDISKNTINNWVKNISRNLKLETNRNSVTRTTSSPSFKNEFVTWKKKMLF